MPELKCSRVHYTSVVKMLTGNPTNEWGDAFRRCCHRDHFRRDEQSCTSQFHFWKLSKAVLDSIRNEVKQLLGTLNAVQQRLPAWIQYPSSEEGSHKHDNCSLYKSHTLENIKENTAHVLLGTKARSICTARNHYHKWAVHKLEYIHQSKNAQNGHV